MKKSRDSQKVVLIVLIVLLVLTIGYIAFEKYSIWDQTNQIGTFQQGAQYGYEQAVIQVAQQAAVCQQVPLTVGNQTINLVAVECLTAQ
ncbi:hypothetical protein CMI44_00065 [Candidatus Pacearchaeota archaeon]|jgi:Tfp pilus assembly protein PilO|nr:hypothetical protein [Candidatus Pacearchaeota archaeon]|tara:strand:- start:1159 stop:1425 length:267 start_codon:yes stop_codon:yes gene_type:complete